MIKIFEGLRDLTADTQTHSRGGLSFSIVNTQGNGKRLRFSPMLLEKLGKPTAIRIVINEKGTGILVAGDSSGMKLAKGGVLYQGSLVQTLTDAFTLDFSSVTSRSFSQVKILEEDGIQYAEIIILSNNLSKGEDTENGTDEHSGN